MKLRALTIALLMKPIGSVTLICGALEEHLLTYLPTPTIENWPHIFFINHRTSEGRGVAPYIPAV